MRKNLLVLFTMLSFVLPSVALAKNGDETKKKAAVTITAEERKMAEAITAEQLKDYLTFISSDAMGGRDTPSAGLDITAQFIALNLKKWGFKGAGDNGSFFQKMMVRKESVDAKLKIGISDITYGEDFFRVGGNGMVEDSPLVFGGDGWMVKSKGLDAFKGVDVKDKIVVLYSSEPGRAIAPPRPKDVTEADLTEAGKGTDWADPMTNAKMSGAKGVILVASPQIEGIWGRLSGFLGRGSMSIDGLESRGGGNADDDEMLPTLLVNKDAANVLFANESGNTDSASAFELKKSASLSARSKVEKIPTQNVVAIWEGDAKSPVKDEMVAIGAHYDHVGTDENDPGEDKIWNGADDDGSGTTGVLAIAEALAKAPKRPKRSVLFVWHTGEEKGLLGAKYFNKYPTVDIKKVITQLNIDMIGRSLVPGTEIVKCGRQGVPCNEELSGPNEVYVIGSEMMSSKLGEITRATNESYLKMGYNYKYDDPKDTNRFFFRSDHFEYAQNGIPIAFWFTGVHLDYHQASDEVDKIDFAKMETIARTIFLTMWELTELKERPVIDKELPKELRSRN